ncbi:hypothetical protein [Gallibacterium anatis]|uniref:hypothetical protein n=1 Tax=Gallibacterium anatis TaxID=750 RepID=UPI000E1BC980|nr:hypothetical protein [Gallibacterium anatis]
MNETYKIVKIPIAVKLMLEAINYQAEHGSQTKAPLWAYCWGVARANNTTEVCFLSSSQVIYSVIYAWYWIALGYRPIESTSASAPILKNIARIKLTSLLVSIVPTSLFDSSIKFT